MAYLSFLEAGVQTYFTKQIFWKFGKFTKSIDSLGKVIKPEKNCAVNCFDENKMIVNPNKFQAILLNKRKTDIANKNIKMRNQSPCTQSAILCFW